MADDIEKTLSNNLMQLLKDNELEKSLTDERIKAEEYKTNYDTLKLDYLRLQQEYAAIIGEMTNVYEEIKLVRERDRGLLEEAKQDIISKLAEIERLKSQTGDFSQSKVSEMQLREEIEDSFKRMMLKQEEERSNLKQDFNKLKIENAFLKSEFENDRKNYLENVDELKSNYTKNIEQITNEKNLQKMEERADALNDLKMLKQTQMDNMQLVSRNKNLMEEMEVLKMQGGGGGCSGCCQRSSFKESEKEVLKRQIDGLKVDLREMTEDKESLSLKIIKINKEFAAEKFKLEEVVQKLRRECSDLSLEMMRKVGAMEKEKEKFKGLYEDSKMQMDIMMDNVTRSEERLAQREKDVAVSINKNKQEMWIVVAELKEDKLKLESTISSLKKDQMVIEEERDQVKKNLDEVLNEFTLYKEKAESELLSFKYKISGHENLLEELEKEKRNVAGLQDKIYALESIAGQRDQMSTGERDALQDKLDSLQNDLRKANNELVRVRLEAEEGFKDRLEGEMKEKRRMKTKMEDLEAQLKNANNKMNNHLNIYKNKNSQLKRLLLRHKEKINSLTTKLNDSGNLETRAEAESLRKKFNELRKKNEDFGRLLLDPQLQQHHVQGLKFTSINKHDYLPDLPDWDSLKAKIHHISELQEHQLKQLNLQTIPAN